ncbi:MAG TPA: PRC-barrel domain-containing protein [Ktedonobacterales bacterium]
MAENNRTQAGTPAQPNMLRATHLAHRPVVNVHLGQNLGEVADIVFDPVERQVAGLLVQTERRDRAVFEMARRAFGGTMGLTYVDLEHVMALNADVVTVDMDQGAQPRPHLKAPLPRLSAVLGFAVVSIEGQRLGHFVDLALDPTGRRIVGYVVEPTTGTTEPSVGTSAPAASETAGAPPMVISAEQDVRVGRDLMVVAGRSDGPRTNLARREQGDIADAPTWQPWESNAPTEEIRH